MTKEHELLYQILNKLNAVETKVEVNVAYQKVQQGRLDKHEKHIEDLVAHKNISIGKKTVWTMVAGAVGAAIMKGLSSIHF